jgi:hypothetical protein
MLIENGKTGESSYYETKFKGLTSKSFEGFHSSQYGKLADKIYKEYF